MWKTLHIREPMRKYPMVGIAENLIKGSQVEGVQLTIGEDPQVYRVSKEEVLKASTMTVKGGVVLRMVPTGRLVRM